MEQTKVPIFLEAILVIKVMYYPWSNLQQKDNPNVLRYDCFLRTDTSICTSIAPDLFDYSNEKSSSFSSIEINNPLSVPVYSVS